MLWLIAPSLLTACTGSTASNPVAEIIAINGLMAPGASHPPAFASIEPGVTTQRQLEEILANWQIAEDCTEGPRTVSCGGLLFMSVDPASNIVWAVGFTPSPPTTLGATIQRYGEPSLIQVTRDGIPEVMRSSALIYFGTIRTRLTIPTVDGAVYDVRASTAIDNILYLSAAQYENITRLGVVPWNGYAEYQQSIR